MKAKSLSGKMKLAKALGEILVKWHMANKPLIEEFLVNNPAHGIARNMHSCLWLIDLARMFDMKSPEALYTLAQWQICGPLENFYQSSINEHLEHTDDLFYAVIKARCAIDGVEYHPHVPCSPDPEAKNVSRKLVIGGSWDPTTDDRIPRVMGKQLGDIANNIRQIIEQTHPGGDWRKNIPTPYHSSDESAPPYDLPKKAVAPVKPVTNHGIFGWRGGNVGASLRPPLSAAPTVSAPKAKVDVTPYDSHLSQGGGGGGTLTSLIDDFGSRGMGAVFGPESFGLVDTREEEGITRSVIAGLVKVGEVTLWAPGNSVSGLTIRAEIVNLRDQDTQVLIPRGMVFEALDQGMRVQNLTMAEERIVMIAANSRAAVVAPGRCMNGSRATPNGVKGRLTIFRYNGADLSQAAVWERMNNPKPETDGTAA